MGEEYLVQSVLCKGVLCKSVLCKGAGVTGTGKEMLFPMLDRSYR